ncbi:N-acetyltransferase DgcN [Zavarzinia sp. CC-PAN008]|uniref:N-acetyltransferase DgcN n=1 Tax=Zavarzinia sp. CC-PAN008 TaxID=3243332 RepID=UPI003F747F44
MDIQRPYLLFIGDARDDLAAKTASGILDWRRDWCLGQFRLPGCNADLKIPDLTIAQAREKGVRTLIIGVANAGGVIPDNWTTTIVEALDAGMDVASGLHTQLGSIPAVAEAARRNGRQLFDVRHNTMTFATGKGTKRPGKRVLTVGTDCSAGKKYTALAIEAELLKRGLKADFRATGQTGIFISGRGVAVDAVVADFISGAAEWISPANDPDHWDVIEGQGSLFHASFAGVSLGLLHGSQPDAIVMCHEPTRTTMRGLPDSTIPDLQACIDANIAMGRLTNPAIHCVGVAVNTSKLAPEAALDYCGGVSRRLGLPCVDPVAWGVGPIVDRLLATT